MENFKPPVPLEWNGKLVLTSTQLAKFYGCTVHQLKVNFSNNRERFVEGVHYIALVGDSLKQFKEYLEALNFDKVNNFYPDSNSFDQDSDNDDNSVFVGKNARILYLWTERGCARHAKMLKTNKAWDVYELLEDTYFHVRDVIATKAGAPVPAPVASAVDLAAIQAQINELNATVTNLAKMIKTAPAAATPDTSHLQTQIDELKTSFETLTYVFEEWLENMTSRRLTNSERGEKLFKPVES